MPNHREGPKTNPGQPVARRRRGIITGTRNQPARALDAGEARKIEEAETQRLMENWARWKSGASISSAVSQAWTLEAKGRREATSVPLLNGEAADVDSAVDALTPELRDVIVQQWLKKGEAEQRARLCSCSVPTYYRRLAHAHERIRALMRAKKDQAERARAIYRAGSGEALVKSRANG